MRVLVRTDASVDIGSGHVMRCLVLAERLRQHEILAEFVCRDLPGNAIPHIQARGFTVHRLPYAGGRHVLTSSPPHEKWLGVHQEQDVRECTSLLERGGKVDWLVVDHYALDSNWELAMRQYARRIFVVDDLADRMHDCDLLLDQNLHENGASRYAGNVPVLCRRLLGPRYALLRPEFSELRRSMPERPGQVSRVLVFFGSIDPRNYTTLALDALAMWRMPGLHVDVVVGSGNPHRAAIERRCAEMDGCTLHVDTPRMGSLMLSADLAIGAGGSSTWERACLKLPSIVFAVADNQRELAASMSAHGALQLLPADGTTPEVLLGAISKLAADRGRLRDYARISGELVDGLGVERVARELLADPVYLREATPEDSVSIYTWRNAEEVRRYARNPAPILQVEHESWFSKVLADPERDLLIAEVNGVPVGVLRYDIQSACQAVVSIYLVPGQSGRGLGPRILLTGERWLLASRPEVTVLQAEILRENAASARAFAEAGYLPGQDAYIKQL